MVDGKMLMSQLFSFVEIIENFSTNCDNLSSTSYIYCKFLTLTIIPSNVFRLPFQTEKKLFPTKRNGFVFLNFNSEINAIYCKEGRWSCSELFF